MTPIRINLLPHRQERRARQQRMFAILMAAAAALGLAVVAAGHLYLANAQNAQQRRNDFLRAEIGKLDKQIAEITELKQKTQSLLNRKEVVESLQSDRGISVRLFDLMARQVPDGLYLKQVKQTGDDIALTGYAQSSARVSTFMRALDETALLAAPTLVEVKKAQVGKLSLNEFALNVSLERPKDKTAPGEAAAGKDKGGRP